MGKVRRSHGSLRAVTGDVGVTKGFRWGGFEGRVCGRQNRGGLLADQGHIFERLALHAEGRRGGIVGGGDAGWGSTQEVVSMVVEGHMGVGLLSDGARAMMGAWGTQAVEAVETVYAALLVQILQRALEGTHHTQLTHNTQRPCQHSHISTSTINSPYISQLLPFFPSNIYTLFFPKTGLLWLIYWVWKTHLSVFTLLSSARRECAQVSHNVHNAWCQADTACWLVRNNNHIVITTITTPHQAQTPSSGWQTACNLRDAFFSTKMTASIKICFFKDLWISKQQKPV